MKTEWKIGEIADLLDTTPKTLRHYEELGLLPKPMRTPSSYRIYDATAISRVTQVLGLRRLGLSVQAVAAIVRDDPTPAEFRRRLVAVLEEKIREADEQISVMQGRREDFAARERSLLLSPDSQCCCSLLSMPCTCDSRQTPACRDLP
ncbi:MAG: hypothetical protein RLZZ169_369 [Pseudomonadota bacterium]|jgi:DNA-binding transcriptional MerR regulator